MATQKNLLPSEEFQQYADQLIDMKARKTKRTFLQQVDLMVDWGAILARITAHPALR